VSKVVKPVPAASKVVKPVPAAVEHETAAAGATEGKETTKVAAAAKSEEVAGAPAAPRSDEPRPRTTPRAVPDPEPAPPAAAKPVAVRPRPKRTRRPRTHRRPAPTRRRGRRREVDALDDLIDGALGSRASAASRSRRRRRPRARARVGRASAALPPRLSRRDVRGAKRRRAGTAARRSASIAAARRHAGTAAAVKAGSSDDNLQFNAFLSFIEANGRLGLRCNVSHRVVVSVRDRDRLPLADADVELATARGVVMRRRTYADGRTLLFPSQLPALRQGAVVRVRYRGRKVHESLLRASRGHRIEVVVPRRRRVPRAVPLDIAFILDTTGSMGDEIDRLKRTLHQINEQISLLSPRPDVRFAMVLYRDRGDAYRVRHVPFTADVQRFTAQLQRVRAGGGGDNPEDVQAALQVGLRRLAWRPRGIRLAFLVGDAPPHLDYGQRYTYVHAMREAAARGIKIATIGASGLDRAGELVWRQIAQYTMSPFVFLTYGEKGDSEGGPSSASVSHHVGSNWVAENLDAIVVRMVKVELAHYAPRGTGPREDYFTAIYHPGSDRGDVLQQLFQRSAGQLIDYAVERIGHRTPTLVLPASPRSRRLSGAARRLQRRLELSIARRREFQLVERRSLPSVIRAQSAQLTERYDRARAVALGKLVPARFAVLSEVAPGAAPGRVEMLVKLVRLQTGEVVSVSLLRIDGRLVGV
jgi:hypothetical protein